MRERGKEKNRDYFKICTLLILTCRFQLVDFGLAHVESQQNSIKEQKGVYTITSFFIS